MSFNLFSLETSTGSGDGGTEGDPNPEGQPDPESQEDTNTGTVPRSELAKANAEAAKYRKQLRETQKRVEELEGHSKTELERERERAANAEAALQEANARGLVLRAATLATSAGVSPEAARDAALLLDWDSVADPEDDDSIVSAFKELVKEKPYLAGRRGSADGGKGSSSGAEPVNMNDLIRRAAGRST